jgi:hypothetical protein
MHGTHACMNTVCISMHDCGMYVYACMSTACVCIGEVSRFIIVYLFHRASWPQLRLGGIQMVVSVGTPFLFIN